MLAAYVVPQGRRPSFPIGEVRGFLRERLPHYMLPAAIMPLDAFPLTATARWIASALPAPSADANAAQREIVAPRHHGNTALGIWAEVLGVDNVGIHDNFFDLGGASIQTLEVVSLANARGLDSGARR